MGAQAVGRVIAACAAALAAVSIGSVALSQGVGASAALVDSAGRAVGSAQFSEVAGGVRISASLRALPPGRHGIHLHAVGRCDAPDFTTAGGHFNPTNRQHGLNNPQGPHAGDLPVLIVTANGTASYGATNALVSLSAGPNSLFDADGTAVVIHADDDDQVTDPTGNSGGRIACGVLVRGAAALPATGNGATGATLPLVIGAAALAAGMLLARAVHVYPRRAAVAAAPSGGKTHDAYRHT